MERTIRENVKAPYSLHDHNIIAFEVREDNMILRTQSGMVKTAAPCTQVDGYVEFHDVRWDFSYVYLLGVTGNVGTFAGEKMYLKEFIQRFGCDQFGAVFGAPDFIEYLNKWVFPDQKSRMVKALGCYETPEEYRNYPQYNF